MDKETAKKILEKTRANYETIASEFSATRSFLWEELKEFGNFIKEGDRVLDLGCGNGRLYRLFTGRDIAYTGIDSSSTLVELAHKIWPGAPAEFKVEDVLEMKYQNEFDVVFAIALLHHIPGYEFRMKALGNIHRALKPGGLLILTVWNLWQKRFWLPHLRQVITKIIGKSELDYGDLLIPWIGPGPREGQALQRAPVIQRYLHGFTLRGLSFLLEGAGFTILDRYYVKRGKRTSWIKGYNIVVIGRK